MAMKETVRSLTLYFFFVGAIAVALAIRDISNLSNLKGLTGGQSFAVYFSIGVQLGLGAAFVLAGASLRGALRSGAGWIKVLVLVSGLFVLIDAAIVVALVGDLPGVRTGAIVRSAVGIAIAVYLHRNITRLAEDASAPAKVA